MPQTIDAIRERRERAGILLDFDGTLARIVPTPEEARPVPGAVGVLRELRRRYRSVAVVSGRRAADVWERIEGAARCFGLYGLEDERGPTRWALEPRPDLDEVVEQVRTIAAAVPGARVEDKGPHVAIHYRAARDPGAGSLLRSRLLPLADRAGLRLLEGKQVLELAPRGGPTKGDVVREVARADELQAILFAGDDLGDVDAFAAVDELAQVPSCVGVTVAVRSAETPPAVVDAATTSVEGPERLVELLRSLL